MAIFTMGLPSLSCGSAISFENIGGIGNQLQMFRIATKSIIANMIKNWNAFAFSVGNGSNKPSIHETMYSIANFIYPDVAIPTRSNTASPYPASCFFVLPNLGKNSGGTLFRYVFNYKHFVHTQIIPLNMVTFFDWLLDKFQPPGWRDGA